MEAACRRSRKKTGIEAEYWRASATKVMDRAMTEFRAGKPARRWHRRRRQRHAHDAKRRPFSKVRFADQSDFPKEVIDPNLGPRYRNVVVGVVYNKVGAEAGRILPNRWKISPSRNTEARSSCPIRHSTRQRHNGSRVCTKSWARKRRRNSCTILPPRNQYGSNRFCLPPSGLPAEKSRSRLHTSSTPTSTVKRARRWTISGSQRSSAMRSYITLRSKAPHVNAGKAFIDYFLGEENMSLMAKLGEFVNRKGVLPPLPGADKFGSSKWTTLSKGIRRKEEGVPKNFLALASLEIRQKLLR